MKQMIKEYWFWTILAMTFCLIIATIGIYNQKTQIKKLKEQNEFEPIRQGTCVYVEYKENYPYSDDYFYCLVYDEATDKTIKVNINEKLNPDFLQVGDVIIYVVDFDFTNAEFLNRIAKN